MSYEGSGDKKNKKARPSRQAHKTTELFKTMQEMTQLTHSFACTGAQACESRGNVSPDPNVDVR